MSNNQKNAVVLLAILSVIFLILFTRSEKDTLLSQKVPEVEIYFPEQEEPQRELMQALLIGPLVLDGKCLKVQENVVVWPSGYSHTNQDGRISVVDRDGELVAAVGDTVQLSGGQVQSFEKIKHVKTGACSGPMWIAGDINTLSANR